MNGLDGSIKFYYCCLLNRIPNSKLKLLGEVDKW